MPSVARCRLRDHDGVIRRLWKQGGAGAAEDPDHVVVATGSSWRTESVEGVVGLLDRRTALVGVPQAVMADGAAFRERRAAQNEGQCTLHVGLVRQQDPADVGVFGQGDLR